MLEGLGGFALGWFPTPGERDTRRALGHETPARGKMMLSWLGGRHPNAHPNWVVVGFVGVCVLRRNGEFKCVGGGPAGNSIVTVLFGHAEAYVAGRWQLTTPALEVDDPQRLAPQSNGRLARGLTVNGGARKYDVGADNAVVWCNEVGVEVASNK